MGIFNKLSGIKGVCDIVTLVSWVCPVMSSGNCIKSMGTLQWDMIELASHLRQERLFVSSEQQNLQILNEKVDDNHWI